MPTERHERTTCYYYYISDWLPNHVPHRPIAWILSTTETNEFSNKKKGNNLDYVPLEEPPPPSTASYILPLWLAMLKCGMLIKTATELQRFLGTIRCSDRVVVSKLDKKGGLFPFIPPHEHSRKCFTVIINGHVYLEEQSYLPTPRFNDIITHCRALCGESGMVD